MPVAAARTARRCSEAAQTAGGATFLGRRRRAALLLLLELVDPGVLDARACATRRGRRGQLPRVETDAATPRGKAGTSYRGPRRGKRRCSVRSNRRSINRAASLPCRSEWMWALCKTRNDYNKVLLPQQQSFSKRWQRRPLEEELPIWDDMIVKMEGMARL